MDPSTQPNTDVPFEKLGHLGRIDDKDISRIGTILGNRAAEGNSEAARALELFNEFSDPEKTRDIYKLWEVMAGIRHLVYKLGLEGGPEQIDQNARMLLDEAFRQAHELPVTLDLDDEALHKEVLIRRTQICLEGLASLEGRALEDALGMTRARFLKLRTEDVAKRYFKCESDGDDTIGEIRLIKIIDHRTPTSDLLNIVAYVEEMEAMNASNSTYERAKNIAKGHLIRRLITSEASSVKIAKRFLTARDFESILAQMRGTLSDGEIGGKSLGVLNAEAGLRINTPEFDLQFAQKYGFDEAYAEKKGFFRRFDESHRNTEWEGEGEEAKCASREAVRQDELNEFLVKALHEKLDLENSLCANTNFFVGSDLFAELLKFNESNPDIADAVNLKENYIDGDVPEGLHKRIDEAVMSADFPPHLKRQLFLLFEKLYKIGRPFIVRSSSFLEDGKDRSFSGRYESQEVVITKDPEKDFTAFLHAILIVGASSFSEKAMRYRRRMDLLEGHDEKMGFLIQVYVGEEHGDYYYPDVSAVGYSRAPIPQGADPREGSIKAAAGMGRRVVDGQDGSYVPLGNALSGRKHDETDADGVPKREKRQKKVAVMNLAEGEIEELNAVALMNNSDHMRSRGQGLYITSRSTPDGRGGNRYFIVPELAMATDRTNLALLNEYILQKLKTLFGYDIDCEFAYLHDARLRKWTANIIQCRPQEIPENMVPSRKPLKVPKRRVLLEWDNISGGIRIPDIRYMVHIDESIYKIDHKARAAVNRLIRAINGRFDTGGDLEGENYVICSAGRFGVRESASEGIMARADDYSRAALVTEVVDTAGGFTCSSAGDHEFGLTQGYGTVWNTMNPKVFNRKGGKFFEEAEHSADFPDIEEFFRGCGEGVNAAKAKELAKAIKVIDVTEAAQKAFETDDELILHCAQDDVGDAEGNEKKGWMYFAFPGTQSPEIVQEHAA